MAPGRPDDVVAGAAAPPGRRERLAPAEREWLLDLARRSIAAGARGLEIEVAEGGLSPALRAPAACFVTLKRHGRLHGCIGTLEPRSSLASAVAANARAAAFFDPRAPRLGRGELEQLEIEISVLSPLEPFFPASEAALYAGLIKGVTGLVLAGHGDNRECRATFLPSVWRQIPEPSAFVAQLKRKAGLPASEPVSRLRFWRYTVEGFSSMSPA